MISDDCCFLDRHEMVLVTHIRDPCQFMIQRVADLEQLQIMMNVINIYCDSTENVHDLLYDVKFGMLVFFNSFEKLLQQQSKKVATMKISRNLEIME